MISVGVLQGKEKDETALGFRIMKGNSYSEDGCRSSQQGILRREANERAEEAKKRMLLP